MDCYRVCPKCEKSRLIERVRVGDPKDPLRNWLILRCDVCKFNFDIEEA